MTRFRLISETNSTIRLDHCECHRRTSEQVSRKFENSKRLKCGQGLDLFVSKCFELNENQDKIIRPSFVVSFDKEQEVYSASLFLSLSLDDGLYRKLRLVGVEVSSEQSKSRLIVLNF